jgi:zinc transport system substrate-binding protein
MGVVAMWAAADAAADLSIQASLYPYYEITRNVAGTAATTEQFLPPGTEVHGWEPTADKLQSLQNADVFVYSGLGVEEYLGPLLDSEDLDVVFIKAAADLLPIQSDITQVIMTVVDDSSNSTQAIQSVREALQRYDTAYILEKYRDGTYTTFETIYHIENLDLSLQRDEPDHITEIRTLLQSDLRPRTMLYVIEQELGATEHGHGHGHADDSETAHHVVGLDPHVWLDPLLVIQQAQTIRDGLSAADPNNTSIYEANTAAYVEEIENIHLEYAEALSDCRKDTIVTSHTSFAYVGERYGLNVIAATSASPTEDISADDVLEVTRYMNEHDINYFLHEYAADSSAGQVIAAETGAEVLVLSPIVSITQQEFQDGVTYSDKMYQNLSVLKTALECQ